MALLWNAIKEAARAAKGQMSKNARNAAKAEAKKERGPVKAFFHITKNENVPAIEQQGLLTNRDIEAVVNTDGIPYTIADIQNVMKDPSLSARERNKYRRDLIEDINATTERFDNPYFLKPGATWKQILRAMMDIQLKAGQIMK